MCHEQAEWPWRAVLEELPLVLSLHQGDQLRIDVQTAGAAQGHLWGHSGVSLWPASFEICFIFISPTRRAQREEPGLVTRRGRRQPPKHAPCRERTMSLSPGLPGVAATSEGCTERGSASVISSGLGETPNSVSLLGQWRKELADVAGGRRCFHRPLLSA